MDASILYDAHATMRSATLGGAPRSSSLPLTTTETSSGQPEDYVPHLIQSRLLNQVVGHGGIEMAE